MSNKVELSIILPVFNEEGNIVSLFNEIDEALRTRNINYEIVAVDDGSQDKSRDLLIEEYEKRSNLKVILFRKNFGQTAAFDAGFQYSTGDKIVTMDADGQNDPADIPRMLDELNRNYDFVAGWRKNRKDGTFSRNMPSKVANFLIRRITKTKIKDLGCSLKLYRREITKDLHLYGEMHRFIGVLVEGLGARVSQLEVNHRPRLTGVSKYSLNRTFKVVLDLITVWFLKSYQTKPIYVFGGAGLLTLGLSAASLGVVAYQKFFNNIWVHKNPLFIIGMILGVVSIQFIALGLIAEMMVRSYFESSNKRPFIVFKSFLNKNQ